MNLNLMYSDVPCSKSTTLINQGKGAVAQSVEHAGSHQDVMGLIHTQANRFLTIENEQLRQKSRLPALSLCGQTE